MERFWNMKINLSFSGMGVYRLCWVCLAVLGISSQAALSQDESAQADNLDGRKIKVLIVDGQNNHDTWPKTTWMMKRYLEETGRFEVEIARTQFTWQGKHHLEQYPLHDGKGYQHLDHPKADPDFKPAFDQYDVVVNNFGYEAARWPEQTEKAFEEYLRSGGGLVVIHAADNCWPDWDQYNRMIGLGGWGGRNEKSGPYVYYSQDEKLVVDHSAGPGGHHGAEHDFAIKIRESSHPIVAGLPSQFLHGRDELYEQLRGPAENLTVLATAFAAPEQGGSNRHEPVLMTVRYHNGRVFHTVLGHADYSMESVGFITTFLRGTEWAATGTVTLPIPDDFPGDEKTVQRKFEAKPSSAADK
jgi:uncharacterized protein